MTRLPKTLGGIELRSFAMSCFTIFAILTSHASAVVILNSDGTANNGQTSAAGTTAPYDNVGVRGSSGATVVYLGNDWAITANHVTIIPGNPSYDYVQVFQPSMNSYEDVTVDKTQQVYNSNGSPTDLKLVHLTSDPGLPSLQIAGSIPSNGQAVTTIGAGMDLGTQQSYTFDSLNYTGFNLTGWEDVPRWGTNDITPWSITHGLSDIGLQNSNNQEEYEYTFATTFSNSPTASNQEAQVTNGDSGGGVFEQIGSTWYLVGLVDGLSTVPLGSGPSDYGYNVFQAGSGYSGEQSIMVDLAPYESIIAAVVPEPSGLILGGLGAGIALLAILRARRQAAGAAAGFGKQ